MSDFISVIIPVYNVAEDLPRCLDSILAQTYPNIEIVAVDDGSSDASGSILDNYAEAHPHIRVIHKENGGVTSARLRGVKEATGEWIGFVDGDDEIEPDMYERLLHNAIQFGAEISHCGYRMVFADGRVNYFHNTGVLEKQDRITALRELLSGERIEPGLCNKLFHRTLFHDLLHNNVMPTEIRINEDLLMNYYLFSAAKNSVFHDVCPYHYMVRSSSASRQKMNQHKIYDPIKAKKIILKDCDDALKRDAEKALLNTCIYTYCSLTIEVDAYAQEKKEIRGLVQEHLGCAGGLPRSTQLLAVMIVRMPRLLEFLYPVYAKHFQQKKYE